MNRGSAALWAAACAGACAVALFPAYWIAAAVATARPTTGEGAAFQAHQWTLSIFVPLWVAISSAAVLALTRLLSEPAPRAVHGAVPWVFTAGGIGAALEFTLLEWGAGRYGSQGADPELLGATAILALIVAMAGIGVLGQIVAPPSARWLPRLATLALAGLVLVISASNLPGGLRDGIGSDSLPLAGMVALSAAYAVASAAFSLRGSASR